MSTSKYAVLVLLTFLLGVASGCGSKDPAKPSTTSSVEKVNLDNLSEDQVIQTKYESAKVTCGLWNYIAKEEREPLFVGSPFLKETDSFSIDVLQNFVGNQIHTLRYRNGNEDTEFKVRLKDRKIVRSKTFTEDYQKGFSAQNALVVEVQIDGSDSQKDLYNHFQESIFEAKVPETDGENYNFTSIRCYLDTITKPDFRSATNATDF